jgi:2-polyprenyl-3-methyl-5-hydroxy-6-metoxy-1,4-benzoquinol methylase
MRQTAPTRDGGGLACNLCGTYVRTDDRVWRKDGHDILRCPSCSLLFRGDPPDRDTLEKIYGPEYFFASAGELQGQGYLDYLAEEDEHRRNARRRLRFLGRYAPTGSLLDIGCAAGFFLDEARRIGWTASGIDVSEAMAGYARDRLGLPVLTTRFLDVQIGDVQFDALTMWDYIEHVVDPRAELQRAAELLRPSGILALSTGDAGSRVARVSGRRWHLLTPRHHNFFFTRANLARYLEEQGFGVLAMKNVWSTYSVDYLAHKAQTLGSGWPLERLIAALKRSPLRMLEIPVNLYDIVTVVARKA